MDAQQTKITVYDRQERMTTTMYVERISDNVFRMTENDVFNFKLNRGTEFETKINENGDHEILRIIKESEFVTRRFFLSIETSQSDYLFLGQELKKIGGFWQVDFGGIATVNIPPDKADLVDRVMRDLKLNLTELTE